MPLDIRAHLAVQSAENFRTEELVGNIHPWFDVIPKSARRHEPRVILSLKRMPDHFTIKKEVTGLRSIRYRQSAIGDEGRDIADVVSRSWVVNIVRASIFNRY